MTTSEVAERLAQTKIEFAKLPDDQKIFMQMNLYCGDLSDSVSIEGKVLVSRRTNNDPVELHPDVRLLSGGFPRFGGSRVNPRLLTEPNTTIEVKNVSQEMYLFILEEIDNNVTFSLSPTEVSQADKRPTW